MTTILTLILAAATLLWTTGIAQADPVSAAILGVIGIQATAAAVAVTTTILSLAASVGLSLLAQLLAPKPNVPEIGASGGRLQAGGIIPRSFVIGRGLAEISLVYANTYGQSGKTPNAYLVQVIACSDLPGVSLAELWVNGAKVTYDPETPPETEGIPIPEFATEPSLGGSKNHMWVRFYDGTQTAADSRLVSLFGSDPDRPYTSARVGEGIAYLVVTTLINEEIFSGFPQVKVVLDGIPLYDPRDDDTVGGDGDQRYNDQTTWERRHDPVTAIYNILRGIRYDGAWVWGGQTVTAPRLPFASWAAAANECDAPVDLVAGGDEPQFRAGGAIRFDMQPADVIEAFLQACLGRVAEIGGAYKIRVGAPGAPVASFTSSTILVTEEASFKPFPPLGQTFNSVAARYASATEAWNLTDAPELIDTDLEAEDGGRRLMAKIDLPLVSSPTQAQRIQKAALHDHRRFRSHVWPLPPSLLHLEPLDVVSVTSPEDGYVDKLFEVVSGTDLVTLDCVRALREVDPADYDWVPAEDERPTDPTPPIIKFPPPQPVSGWQVFPATIDDDIGPRRPTIEVRFDGDLDDIRSVQIQVRLESSEDIVYEVDFPYGETGPAESIRSVILNGVFLPDTDYEVRGRFRPRGERATAWTSWLDVTTPAVRFVTDDIDVGAIITDRIADNAITAAKLLDGAVTAGKIGAGELALVHFATSIRPVEILSSLPATGNFAGRTVFLTTDSKIYRHTGSPAGASGFTVATDGADIVAGSITAGKIAAGAIGADQIAANAVAARHMMVMDFTNLLENPGFEVAGGAGWTLTGDITVGGAGSAYNGAPSFLSLGVGSGTATNRNDAIKVAPGDEFLITAAITRATGASGSVTIKLVYTLADGSTVDGPARSVSNSDITTAGVYQLFSSSSASSPAPATVRTAKLVITYSGLTGAALRVGFVGLYRRNGGSLIVDGAISASKVLAGSIGATQIAANSISATHLVLSDFTNLLENPGFLKLGGDGNPVGWTLSGGVSWWFVAGAFYQNWDWGLRFQTGGGSAVNNNNQIKVKPGDELLITAPIRRHNAVAVMSGSLTIRVRWVLADGSESSGPTISISDVSGLPNTYSTMYSSGSGSSPAPSNVRHAKLEIINGVTGGNVSVGYVGLFRRNTAELIVDGSIIAGKLAAGAINAGTIIADEIIVGGHLINGAASQWWRANNAIAFAQMFVTGDILVSVDVTVSGRTNGATQGDVEIFVASPAIAIASGGSAGLFQLQLQRDGTTIRASQYSTVNIGGGSFWYIQNDHTFYWLDRNVSVGSHTYRLRYQHISGGTFNFQNQLDPWNLNITVKELRR